MSDIYNMNLHEELGYDDFFVIRVPGGWIYTIRAGNSPPGVFVPFDNEFQEQPC